MSDPLFFPPKAALTLAALCAVAGAAVPAGADADRLFHGVAAIDQAGPRVVAVLTGESGEPDPRHTRAGVCLVAVGDAARLPAETIALIVDDPARAFARLVAVWHPGADRPASMFATRGISPAAFIHFEARLEADVIVDPGVVIGPKAEIGSGTIVGANSVIGPDVRIGRNCAIGSQVTITHALIGNDVIVHPGARIGQDGASHRPTSAIKIAGLGRVIIQDTAEIGANATIDRGGLGDTIVGEGSRIANLAHIPADRTIPRRAPAGLAAKT